jgi:hypothetical protein
LKINNNLAEKKRRNVFRTLMSETKKKGSETKISTSSDFTMIGADEIVLNRRKRE